LIESRGVFNRDDVRRELQRFRDELEDSIAITSAFGGAPIPISICAAYVANVPVSNAFRNGRRHGNVIEKRP
jgi:hypothetical protein